MKNLTKMQFFAGLKSFIALKLRVLGYFEKSPKKSPFSLGSLTRKKIAKNSEKEPKWREIAQSGHTDLSSPIDLDSAKTSQDVFF